MEYFLLHVENVIFLQTLIIYQPLMVQAYHNELVGKVSRLEEENVKLKKEKVSDPIHLFFLFKALFNIPCIYCIDVCIFFC